MICLRMLALVSAPAIQHEMSQNSAASTTIAISAVESEVKKKLSSIEDKVDPESTQLSTPEEVTEAVKDTVLTPEPNEEIPSAVADSIAEQPVADTLVFEADSTQPSATVEEQSAPDTAPEIQESQEQEPQEQEKDIAEEPVTTAEASTHVATEGSDMSDADWDRMYDSGTDNYDGDITDEPLVDSSFEKSWEPQAFTQDGKISLANLNQENWIELTKSLNLSGLAGELLLNSQWLATKANTIHLKIFLKNVDSLAVKSTLTTVLTEYFSQVIKLDFEAGETGDATARAQLIKEQEERQQQAEEIVANDPYIKSLEESFGAIVVEGSVRVLSVE